MTLKIRSILMSDLTIGLPSLTNFDRHYYQKINYQKIINSDRPATEQLFQVGIKLLLLIAKFFGLP